MCTKSKKNDTKNFRDHYNGLEYKKRQLLKSKIAEACGVEEQTVTRWANGKRFPKKPTRKEIARVAGVKVTDFFPNHYEVN